MGIKSTLFFIAKSAALLANLPTFFPGIFLVPSGNKRIEKPLRSF